MTVQFDEYPQWTDASGTPLTSGKVYIGTVNLAPKTNTISIFSDRDLTVALANPQTLDAFGKATTRIFIPGKYSYLVEDSAEVQVELELDAGAESDTGTTSLDTVLGTNTITASGEATTVTSYDNLEVYTFTVANTNTSTVTLNIDSIGAKAIVKNFNQGLDGGDFTQNQIVRVAYNSTSDNFAWVDASVKTKRVTKGSDIASATSITIPDNDGNLFDITGSTGPIATINGVAGTLNTFQMDSTPTFTNSASLIMIGGADFTAAAGDVLEFYQLTSSTVINTKIERASGVPIAMFTAATQAEQETGTSILAPVTPGRQQYHVSAVKAWVKFDQTGPTIDASYNITSVTDTSTGVFTINLINAFSSAEYAISGIASRNTSSVAFFSVQGGTNPLAGSAIFETRSSSVVLEDMQSYTSFFGDQP